MREIRRAFLRAEELPGELYGLELRVDEDSAILAFTSDQSDRLVGFHHPRLLICVTEGQGCEEAVFESAHACATAPENRQFVYGNPTKPSGGFYRVAHSDNWQMIRIPASEHPNVVSGREEIPGAVSREWVRNMEAEYGAGSSICRSRIDARFPEESIEGLVTRVWMRAAVERWELGNRPDLFLHPPMLALDIARYGPDASVLAEVRGPRVERLITWRGASIVQSVDRVIEHGRAVAARHQEELRAWGAIDAPLRLPPVWVDEPGLGGGAIDFLRQRGYPTVAFNGAEQASDPSKWFNKRAEAFWNLRTLLEAGTPELPPEKLLEEDAMAVEWMVAANGSIQILSKDLIRKELGRSPDRLDAVVIALFATARRPEWKSVRVVY